MTMRARNRSGHPRWATTFPGAAALSAIALVVAATTPAFAGGPARPSTAPRQAHGSPGATLVAHARRVGAAPTAPAHAVDLGTLASSTPMHLVVALQPRDPGGLEQYATAVATPGNGAYRRYLSPRQFARRFGATTAALDATRAALRADGLQVGPASVNRLSLPITGTAARVGATFGTGFRRYRLSNGRAAFANTAAPLLQPAISGFVQNVIGLDTLHLPQRIGAGDPPVPAHAAAATQNLAPQVVTGGPQPCAAAVSAGTANGAYTADRLASAYRFSPLYAAGAFGQGVHVALLELDGSNPADVATYQSCYGTNATVNYLPVDGGNPSAQTGEPNLDIETIIGLAPQATFDVYQAPSVAGAYYDVLNAIVTADTAPVVSISWGGCELGSTRADEAPYSTLFAEAAVQGQSVFAASGDDGDACPLTGGQPIAVEFPADDPFVTGVGGTRLQSGGPPPSEVVWDRDCSGIACTTNGTGGGISTLWPMPSYQSGAPADVNVINGNSSGAPCAATSGFCREVPDVAADADPQTGYVVDEGGWGVLGGTSAAAPLWAAMTALIDSTPACAGTSVGFANPALYRAAARSYATYFNDVTVGTNDTVGLHNGLYPAGPGYDMTTGLGTPNAGALAGALCRAPTVYVANTGGSTVTPVIGNVVGAPIPVGTAPFGIAITPDGTTAYVGNAGSNTVTPFSTITNTPGTPIPVGTTPEALAITPNGKTVYVVNGTSGTVTPIATATNTAGAPITVGSQPVGLAITPNGKYVFVANSGSNSITRITVATNTSSKTITVGSGPRELAVTPDGSTLYVANGGSNTVTPVTIATNHAGAPIPVGPAPYGVAITPDGATVYVSNSGSNTVTPISTPTKTAGAPITVGSAPFDLAVTPDGSTVDVTSYAGNSIVPIATATNTAGPAVLVGPNPQGIAIEPDQSPVARFTHGIGLDISFSALTSGAPGAPIASYSWDFGDGSAPVTSGNPDVTHTFAMQGSYHVRLTVTDTAGTAATQVFTGRTVSRDGAASATATAIVVAEPAAAYVTDYTNNWLAPLDGSPPIAVGTGPLDFAITPDGRTAYVTDSDGVTPITIATQTAGPPIPVPGGAFALAITPDGSTLYVTGNNTVTPVDTATNAVGSAIPVGSDPQAIAVTPDGKTVYVVNNGSNSVTPVDVATDTAGPAIPVGARPDGVTVTPNGKTVYVSNFGDNTVTPITVATNTAGPAIAVGGGPGGLAVNPSGTSVYVTDYLDGTVTPITVATDAPGPAISVVASPVSVAFSPDGALAYVVGDGTPGENDANDGVTPIQTATKAALPRIPTVSGTYEPTPFDVAVLPDQAPTAAFGMTRAPAGQATQFDASASIANGAPIVRYQWTFGDGSTATTSTATTSHTYAAAGNYRVKLTLTDAYGTSTKVVFTGRTVSRNGSKHAAITKTVRIKS